MAGDCRAARETGDACVDVKVLSKTWAKRGDDLVVNNGSASCGAADEQEGGVAG